MLPLIFPLPKSIVFPHQSSILPKKLNSSIVAPSKGDEPVVKFGPSIKDSNFAFLKAKFPICSTEDKFNSFNTRHA